MSAALDAARAALRGGEAAWIVGGAVRDRLLGRAVLDVDVAIDGDVRRAARRLARHVDGPAFPLSEAFGAWRVHGPGHAWHVDLVGLRDGSLEADLAARDFTVNAIAEPLEGGALVDPHDGSGDLRARRLRMVAPAAFDDDPLRVLRLARLACELALTADPDTVAAARERAPRLADVAAERVFAELRRIVVAREALDGLELLDELGATAIVLPELDALRGVRQNRYHHLDVHDHTLATLQEVVRMRDDPTPLVGAGLAGAVRAFVAEPFADELDRDGALRLGALLHDIAKPQTRAFKDDGSILGFPGHAEQGADVARAILARLRTSERLRAHVAALARHHLRAGFLVHRQPLTGRAIHDYLVACGPVAVDVTLLSIADRLATRGDNAGPAIDAHLAVARELLAAALAHHRDGPAPALVRGDELAAALGIAPGPQLGAILAELAAAQYAGEIATTDQAIAHARDWLAARDR